MIFFRFVLITLILSLSVSNIQSQTSPTSIQSQSRTYDLIVAEFSIWTYISESMSFEPFFSPSLNDGDTLGDVKLSEYTNEIYYIVNTVANEEGNLLYRYDIFSKQVDLLYQHDNLARITAPSISGSIFLLFSDLNDPTNSSICLFSSQEKSCDELTINLDFNDFFWIDNTSFTTAIDDEIRIYEISQGEVSNTFTYEFQDMLGDIELYKSQNSLIGVMYEISNDYQPEIQIFNLSTYDVNGVSHINISQENTSILTNLTLSLDERLLKFNRGTTTSIFDFNTGESILEIHDVIRSSWSISNRLFIVAHQDSDTFEVSVVDVDNAEILTVGEFQSEIYFL